MSNFNLISDVSLLTSVPYTTLTHMCNKGMECICHGVLESANSEERETIIDLSIGELKIIVDDEQIYYKFKPSPSLEEMLVNAISTNDDPLVNDIEDNLMSKVLKTYKDLV